MESEPEPELPAEIDFQTTVDNWANAVGGDKGIIIYDLDLDKVAGTYNADTKFQTASNWSRRVKCYCANRFWNYYCDGIESDGDKVCQVDFRNGSMSIIK